MLEIYKHSMKLHLSTKEPACRYVIQMRNAAAVEFI